MRIVTYNIQYGIGLDGAFDLARIAGAVRDADLIALQEVSRNNPRNGGADLVAGLRKLLPDYFSVFGAPFGVDVGSTFEDGRVVERRFEFGNMVLSKTPVLASRNLLLPRGRTYGTLNLQRGALEVLVDTPLGPIRFYSLHLDHTGPQERLDQIRFLMARAVSGAREGGAVTGLSEFGFPELPETDAFMLLGDFNAEPGSPEYLAVTGMPDVSMGLVPRAANGVDAARIAQAGADETATCIDVKHADEALRYRRIDYGFVHPALAGRVRSARVDTQAAGSDHRPVWFELE